MFSPISDQTNPGPMSYCLTTKARTELQNIQGQ